MPTPGTLPSSRQAPAVPCLAPRHSQAAQVPIAPLNKGRWGHVPPLQVGMGTLLSPDCARWPLQTQRDVACAFPGAFHQSWVFFNR